VKGWTEYWMPGFHYLNGDLHCEDLPMAGLAEEYGTPLYVYSANTLRENYRRLAAAFAPLDPLICYAVKANFNLAPALTSSPAGNCTGRCGPALTRGTSSLPGSARPTPRSTKGWRPALAGSTWSRLTNWRG
jgi:hypothetical protein